MLKRIVAGVVDLLDELCDYGVRMDDYCAELGEGHVRG